jgi:hypothetical protein
MKNKRLISRSLASLCLIFISAVSFSVFAEHHKKAEEEASENAEMVKDKMHHMTDEAAMSEEEMQAKMEKEQAKAKAKMADVEEEVEPD